MQHFQHVGVPRHDPGMEKRIPVNWRFAAKDDLTPEKLELPPLDKKKYTRPPMHEQSFIPETYR